MTMNNGMMTVTQEDKLKTLIAEIDRLPPSEKAQLLGSLLGNPESGMSVVFGNGHNHVLSAEIVVQINSADPAMIQSILSAIASRIEKRS